MNTKKSPAGWREARAFSLPEFLVATAIFVLLSSFAITASRKATQQDELNAAAYGLASWLEAVRQDARRDVMGCLVTFTTGEDLAVGSELVSVAPLRNPSETLKPESCQANKPFRLGWGSSSNALTMRIIPNTSATSLVFTPRGTVTLANNDMTLTLRQGNSAIVRCVRISRISGMVTTGANNNGENNCSDVSFRNSL